MVEKTDQSLDCEIRVPETQKPIAMPMRRMSPHQNEEAEKSTTDLLGRGMIERGTGAWRATHCVGKEEGWILAYHYIIEDSIM